MTTTATPTRADADWHARMIRTVLAMYTVNHHRDPEGWDFYLADRLEWATRRAENEERR